MAFELASNQRAFLRSMANRLKATVWIGKQGLSEQVVAAVDAALDTEELLKIKILEASPLTRREIAPRLAEALGCAIVQGIGRVMVVYRPGKKERRIRLPEPSVKKADPEPKS